MSAPARSTDQSPLAAGFAPATAGGGQDIELAMSVSGLNGGQIEVLRRTISRKFTTDQLLLYVAICSRRGVDPFTEAYGFPNSDGGLAFGLRIDGMRSLAMRTGDYISRKVETIWDHQPYPAGGIEPPPKLAGARCEIQRKGMSLPVIEEAWMAEYAKTGIGWDKYPETMIRKVAESKALRAAFPDALGGIYEPAEIQE